MWLVSLPRPPPPPDPLVPWSRGPLDDSLGPVIPWRFPLGPLGPVVLWSPWSRGPLGPWSSEALQSLFKAYT